MSVGDLAEGSCRFKTQGKPISKRNFSYRDFHRWWHWMTFKIMGCLVFSAFSVSHGNSGPPDEPTFLSSGPPTIYESIWMPAAPTASPTLSTTIPSTSSKSSLQLQSKAEGKSLQMGCYSWTIDDNLVLGTDTKKTGSLFHTLNSDIVAIII